MVDLVVATAVCVGAATVQSSAGFGFALVLAPVLLVLLPPAQAIGVVLVLGVGLNLLVLCAERRPRQIAWRLMRPVLLAALPGLVFGALVVKTLPKGGLQLVVGVAVVLAAGGQMRGRPTSHIAAEPRPSTSAAIGVATGILTTATSASGALLAIWLHRQKIGGARLRDSLSAAFLILNSTGAAVLSLINGRSEQFGRIAWLLALAPAVAAGHLAGRRVFRRLSPRRHAMLVLICVLIAGTSSLASGAVALAQ